MRVGRQEQGLGRSVILCLDVQICIYGEKGRQELGGALLGGEGDCDACNDKVYCIYQGGPLASHEGNENADELIIVKDMESNWTARRATDWRPHRRSTTACVKWLESYRGGT